MHPRPPRGVMRAACVFLSANVGLNWTQWTHSSLLSCMVTGLQANRNKNDSKLATICHDGRAWFANRCKRGKVAGLAGHGSRAGVCRSKEVGRNEKLPPIATPLKARERRASQFHASPSAIFFLFPISFNINSFASTATQTTTNYNGISLT